MSYIKFFLISIFTLVLSNSCYNERKKMVENNNDVTIVQIPTVTDVKNVNVICNLDYIILEAKKNSYFGFVSKLRVYKNRIFILDRRYAKSLLVYTSKGEHITTIGDKKGRGPLEFINLANFEIDYANDQILTIDDFGSKFLIYDLDGKFIRKVDSEIPILNAVLLPQNFILHAKASWEYKKPPLKNGYQIIVTDDKKQIVKERFNVNDNKNLNIHIYDIINSQFDGGFNFAPIFRDTIYSVSLESITPKYVIDYGSNKKISESKIREFKSINELYDFIDVGFTCFMGKHVESEDFLYLSLGYHRNQIYVFFNKKTNNAISIRHKAEIAEYNYELYRLLCSDEDGYFYGAFNFADMDELTRMFPNIKKLYISAEDMNPILFRYKVRL